MDLFVQYQAFCENGGLQCASFTTFRRMMISVFKHHLKFRDKGDFGQCDVCFKLRKRIRNAANKFIKAAHVKLYSEHLLQQWADRQFYWNLRSLSRHYFSQLMHFNRRLASASTVSSSILTIIQDGMDQAKLRLPRWGYGTLSKAATKLFRPAAHLAASWVHGFRLNLFLSDENMKKNSETSIEHLCLSLEHLFSQCSSLPLTLHLQQDNCYREGKNKFVVRFLLLLQILGVFRFTAMGFLRTSHSHDDVDQVFGQIARLLMGKACQSASDMISLLEHSIEQGLDSQQAGRLRGSVATVAKLDQVSCWKEFGAQVGVSFKGLRHVHYFRFCTRKDLGPDVLNNVDKLDELGARWVPHPDDVFLVTKRWLSDIKVQQAVCVVSAAVASEIRMGFHLPAGLAPRRAISEKIVKNLQKRVPICEKSGELSREGAKYLLEWSQGTLAQNPRPERYTFLNHRWSPDMLAERHLPGNWRPPRRVRHVDLTLAGDPNAASDSSDSDEGPLNLPIGMGDA